MGNTCKPMAASFQCMTKSTTIKKKKLFSKSEKKKERKKYFFKIFIFIYLAVPDANP